MANISNTNAAATPAVHVGKYANGYSKAGATVTVAQPFRFALAATPLFVGVAPKGANSVMGVLFGMAQAIAAAHAKAPKANPALTGASLHAAAMAHNWGAHGHRSAYAKPGTVCGQWVAGYITGAVRHKHLSITAPAAK